MEPGSLHLFASFPIYKFDFWHFSSVYKYLAIRELFFDIFSNFHAFEKSAFLRSHTIVLVNGVGRCTYFERSRKQQTPMSDVTWDDTTHYFDLDDL